MGGSCFFKDHNLLLKNVSTHCVSENLKLSSSSYIDQTKGIFLVSVCFFCFLASTKANSNKREQLNVTRDVPRVAQSILYICIWQFLDLTAYILHTRLVDGAWT